MTGHHLSWEHVLFTRIGHRRTGERARPTLTHKKYHSAHALAPVEVICDDVVAALPPRGGIHAVLRTPATSRHVSPRPLERVCAASGIGTDRRARGASIGEVPRT